ncbi:MAG TPA: 50S ribosomal protein L11 methyltransferase [Gemmatimonadales bacterium]|nr:50S ribosomal protein L11 methyltransferase [Gemmatimonadales bacterium]
MTWWAIDVRTPPEHREAVGAWLVQRTGNAVEERDDGVLVGVATDELEAERLLAELAQRSTPAAAERRVLDPVDWSVRWREGLGPRRIGRLTVAPSWAAPTEPAEPLLVLDPETAFGSGEHGSTRSALALLNRQLHARDRVLDLGSGSGILAIAAVKLGAVRATGIELDAEANVVAARNAERNQLTDRVTFLEGDAAVLTPLAAPVELICANILRTVNTSLLPTIAAALVPSGCAVFAGMEAGEAPLFLAALNEAGFAVVDQAVDAGWWGVAARVP